MYDTKGRLTWLSYPNGVAGSYVYNAAGDLTGIAYTYGAGTIDGMTYGYDNMGRILNQVRRVGGMMLPVVSGGMYNGANRLVSFSGRALEHDANGNLRGFRDAAYTWPAK